MVADGRMVLVRYTFENAPVPCNDVMQCNGRRTLSHTVVVSVFTLAPIGGIRARRDANLCMHKDGVDTTDRYRHHI